MSTRLAMDPGILVQYIIMSYENDERLINSRLINDILYAFQLCHMRYYDEPLFIGEFKAGHDGPELFKTFDRDFNRQLTKVVFNQLDERYLIEDWVNSVKKTNSSVLHKIAINSMSPWSVRYRSDSVVDLSNDDLCRYANADSYDRIEGSYLEKVANSKSSGTLEQDNNYQEADSDDWRHYR